MLAAGPAAAYEQQYNSALATCTIPPVEDISCSAAVEIYLAALTLAGVEEQLADASIASFVVALVRSAPAAMPTIVGAPIRAVTDAIADLEVQGLVNQVVQAVDGGN